MPTSPALSAAHRSPVYVRALLLSACAAGLVGLAAPGHSAPVRLTSAGAALPASLDVEPPVQHGAVTVPTRHVVRASRSRTPAAKPATLVAAKHNAQSLAQLTGWTRPAHAPITSPYGMRWGRLHAGCDFGAHYGDPIYAIGDGIVEGVGYQSGESGYGQITIIKHANGFYSAYAHQSRYVVTVGQHVTTGEVIGYVGATGEVTGPHLHFEIRTAMHGHQINPVPWLEAHGVSV